MSVFFNLFAAAEPSADVCVVHGTHAMMHVSILLSLINEFISSLATSVCVAGTPGNHSRNPEVLRNLFFRS